MSQLLTSQSSTASPKLSLSSKRRIDALRKIIRRARVDFERDRIDHALLVKLYTNYNPVPDAEKFIDIAISQFPKLACGVATVYLQHLLSVGRPTNGRYDQDPHTFLALPNDTIIDITADQYGGPPIHIGVCHVPWYRTSQGIRVIKQFA